MASDTGIQQLLMRLQAMGQGGQPPAPPPQMAANPWETPMGGPPPQMQPPMPAATTAPPPNPNPMNPLAQAQKLMEMRDQLAPLGAKEGPLGEGAGLNAQDAITIQDLIKRLSGLFGR
jgi:hypothetical protein